MTYTRACCICMSHMRFHLAYASHVCPYIFHTHITHAVACCILHMHITYSLTYSTCIRRIPHACHMLFASYMSCSCMSLYGTHTPYAVASSSCISHMLVHIPYACAYKNMHACMCVCACIQIYASVCVHAYRYTQVCVCMHTDIHILQLTQDRECICGIDVMYTWYGCSRYTYVDIHMLMYIC